MLNALYRTAGVLGVEIRYEAEVTALEIEDGMFLSATLGGSSPVRIEAKTLVAAAPSLFPPIQADSIRGLAVELGLDPDALDATVTGFNAAVRPGTFDDKILDDCRTEGLNPPKTHWARRIETPPLYAYPVRPGITFTYLGTRVNREARIMMKDGKPSANMFAAGEIMAGNVLGEGYAAGIGMTIGAVFGRVAGREAARNARN